MKLIASILVFATALLTVPARAEEPTNVTMIQLIANPDGFNGKLIRVIGFLRIEFEGNVLYLHREDYENGILGDGIWVDVTPEMMKQDKSLNTKYVLLEGVFSSSDHGHMGVWRGTITKIRRAEFWSDESMVTRRGQPLPPPPKAQPKTH